MNSIKKIWILNHYANSPDRGGSLRHFNFAKKLIKRGYDVIIFAASTIHNSHDNYTDGKSKYIKKVVDDVPFVFVRTSSYFGNGIARVKNMADYYFGVRSAAKDFGDVDIVYASSPHPLAWLAGKKIAKKKGAKLIIETRDLWPETFVNMGKMGKNNPLVKVLYSFEKIIYKDADRLLFTFPGGAEYVEKLGLDTSKVRYINNGIDYENFVKQQKNIVFKDERYSKSGFKVVFAGAMGKGNALDVLLKAAKELQARKVENVNIFIFGQGPEETNLKDYAKENQIRNVHFMGSVKKECIPNILSQANLNILTLAHMPKLFKYGLSPNKLFDYFASGKPILSNVECGYDLLAKHGCGFTVGKDPIDLAEGILKVYNMKPEEYSELANNASIAAQEYDFEKLTDALVDVIEN